MAVARFQRIQFSDPDLTLFANRIAETFDAITSNPLLGGNLIKQVNLFVGSNILSHGLGRNYVSFFAGNSSAPARFSYGGSPDPSTYINVVSDAACSADVLVL